MFFDWTIIIALIISVTVHEFCHAWTATYLGDPTAKYQGRLTLNPLAHLDPVGTLMLVLVHFGWGRPVPFNLANLKNPRVDAALISASGPLSNLLMALVVAIPYRYIFLEGTDLVSTSSFALVIMSLMKTMIELNLVLMVFNMLPIPPLDGSKIFSLLVPGNLLPIISQYRNVGYGILIALVFSDMVIGVNLLGDYILSPLVQFFWEVVLFSS